MVYISDVRQAGSNLLYILQLLGQRLEFPTYHFPDVLDRLPKHHCNYSRKDIRPVLCRKVRSEPSDRNVFDSRRFLPKLSCWLGWPFVSCQMVGNQARPFGDPCVLTHEQQICCQVVVLSGRCSVCFAGQDGHRAGSALVIHPMLFGYCRGSLFLSLDFRLNQGLF